MENKKKVIITIDPSKVKTLKLAFEKYILENPDEYSVKNFSNPDEAIRFLMDQSGVTPIMIFSTLGEYYWEQSIAGLENLQKEFPAVPIFLVSLASQEIFEKVQKKIKIEHRFSIISNIFFSEKYLDDLKEKVKSYL